ncbi:LAQU0S07e04918g1_1 [Lachancea quebecensis]|uniref:LAQU0S07e04918g1_1 n=1 Tax=Lachancea quebecensis TaxID=1654605 RepID=A0A0P1KSW9_9SACH|nr:LAQU0S07e04918g1_1 [Lachancea quebecensis]
MIRGRLGLVTWISGCRVLGSGSAARFWNNPQSVKGFRRGLAEMARTARTARTWTALVRGPSFASQESHPHVGSLHLAQVRGGASGGVRVFSIRAPIAAHLNLGVFVALMYSWLSAQGSSTPQGHRGACATLKRLYSVHGRAGNSTARRV